MIGDTRLIVTWLKLIFKFIIKKAVDTKTVDQTAAAAYIYIVCGYLLKKIKKRNAKRWWMVVVSIHRSIYFIYVSKSPKVTQLVFMC